MSYADIGSASDVGESELFTLEVGARHTVGDDIVVLDLLAPDRTALPTWQPGAHLEITLPGVEGTMVRHYSLCGDPERVNEYRIAVLVQTQGRGGSSHIARNLQPGSAVRVRGPRNSFPLDDAQTYVFVAGGIGITPILAMAREAAAGGKDWRAVYLVRDRQRLAFDSDLEALGPRATVWVDDERGRFDLEAMVQEMPTGAHLYACGPGSMLDALETLHTSESSWQLHLERFAATTKDAGADTAFDVVINSSGRSVPVPPGCSILSALREHGLELDYSCEEGICGTCETAVLEGIPDHRDAVLSADERESNETMMVCVSRALSKRLVLDV